MSGPHEQDVFELDVEAPAPLAWTTARRWALRMVVAGKVTWTHNTHAGTEAYRVAGEVRASQPQPFRWLRDQGLVELGPEQIPSPGIRRRDVTATDRGLGHRR